MNDVFGCVLSLSLSGTLVALLVFALFGLLRKKVSKAWRYYVWLIVLLRLLVPFAPQGHNLIGLLAQSVPNVPLAAMNMPPSNLMATGVTGEEVKASLPEEPSRQPFQNPQPAGENNDLANLFQELWRYAWVLWLGVSLMLWVRALTSYHSFTRFIRAGWQAVDDPAALDALSEVSARYGIQKKLPLYLNPLAASPMLVGIWRPVIVLPTLQLEERELRYILAHELVHFKRRDILYKWLVQAVCCLHWFNPVAYLIKKDISAACELSCDEQVLSGVEQGDHRKYGDTLLKVVQTSGQYMGTVASVTMSEEGKIMKKRLQAIAFPHHRTKWTAMLSVLLSALLLFGAAYAGAYTGLPTPTEIPEGNAPSISSGATKGTPEPTKNGTADDLEANAYDTYYSDIGIIINDFYYDGSYIFHLQYGSFPRVSDYRALEKPTVVVGTTELKVALEDVTIMEGLQKAADDFVSRHAEAQARDTRLRLVRLDGPYKASADLLLSRFYKEDTLGSFWAVLRSGLPSAEQRYRLLKQACKDGSSTYLSFLLKSGISMDYADELLKIAYDDNNEFTFFLVWEHASPEGKQKAQDWAVRDRRIAFFGIVDAPGEEAIDAMLEGMGNDLDAFMIAMVADSLTEEQALYIASKAYEQGDVGLFSIVIGHLSDEDLKAFHNQALQDKNRAFIAVTQ